MPQFANETIRLPINQQSIYVDEVRNMEIPITYYSEALTKGRKLAEQLIMERNKEKFLKGEKQGPRMDKIVFPGGVTETTVFTVELTPAIPFITVPSNFTIVNPYKVSISF